MSYYLGIDLGTQSLKALIYDAETRSIAASASSPLELHSGDDGAREQQASWWLEALHAAIGKLPGELRRGVVALGVSGQQHGFVPVAASGEVLAPVKLWCDTATTTECDEITQRFGGAERCIAEVGNPILPGYTASKILWLKKHRPDAYAELATVLLPHDYLNFYLTGERFMEYGDASGTGLLDIRQRQWHRGMAAALDPDRDLSRCLPPLLEPGEAGGQLRSQRAAELGLPAGIPVACGGGDNMMAALGTGTVRAGRLTVSLGTSGTLFTHADQPCIDAGGHLAAFCSSTGGWLPLLCTMNCTVATEQARQLFQLDFEGVDTLLQQSAPGANGVVVLPFYNGERTPNLPNGRGCIMGLTLNNNSRANILQASMEAAVFGLRGGMEAIERVGCPVDEIRLTGGGSRNPHWRQMIADVFNLPVHMPALDEGAALGAALTAMITERGLVDHQAAADLVDEHVRCDTSATALPDPERYERYANAYQHYQRYLSLVQPLFH